MTTDSGSNRAVTYDALDLEPLADHEANQKTSAPDTLMSSANMLRKLGWRACEPLLQEVVLPQLPGFSLNLKNFFLRKPWRGRQCLVDRNGLQVGINYL